MQQLWFVGRFCANFTPGFCFSHLSIHGERSEWRHPHREYTCPSGGYGFAVNIGAGVIGTTCSNRDSHSTSPRNTLADPHNDGCPDPGIRKEFQSGRNSKTSRSSVLEWSSHLQPVRTFAYSADHSCNYLEAAAPQLIQAADGGGFDSLGYSILVFVRRGG